MQEQQADRIRGVLYGQAIGDALGLGTEFLSRADVSRYYPHGLRDYQQIVHDGHRSRWVRGDWTDDTDQMLCILDSLLALRAVVPTDIARRLQAWAANGGMGIGRTVAEVLASPVFVSDPHSAAREVWERGGRHSAANGAVMRTSVLGVWDLGSPERIRCNAETVCRITHCDPRCVASCVAVCLAVGALIGGRPVAEVLQTAAEAAETHHPGMGSWILEVADQPLEDLELDEPSSMGFTFKAVAAGFWALRQAKSIADGIEAVVNQGGDADSNAAVTGALLGARDGFSSIPSRWVTGLRYEQDLHSRVDRLLGILDETVP